MDVYGDLIRLIQIFDSNLSATTANKIMHRITVHDECDWFYTTLLIPRRGHWSI